MAGPAAGGAYGEGGASTLGGGLSVVRRVFHGRRGQRQRHFGFRGRQGRQRDGDVQAGVAALRRLRCAVQAGCQQSILVVSAGDLRRIKER